MILTQRNNAHPEKYYPPREILLTKRNNAHREEIMLTQRNNAHPEEYCAFFFRNTYKTLLSLAKPFSFIYNLSKGFYSFLNKNIKLLVNFKFASIMKTIEIFF